jgi:hypothetical protein
VRNRGWIDRVLSRLAGVGSAALARVELRSPRLGRALLDRVGARTGLRVEADRFRLNLVRGVRLEGVRVTSESPGGRLTARAAHLVAEHRLPALLRGRVEVDRILIHEPSVELVTPPGEARSAKAPAPAIASGEEGGGPVLAVGRVLLHDGALAVRAEGAPEADVEIRGLEADLHDLSLAKAVQGLRAEGGLRTGEIRLGRLAGTEGSGRLRLADGHLVLEDFGLNLRQGRFLLDRLDADLTLDPFAYRLSLGVDPLDTNAVLAAGPGGGFGPGVVRFAATGSGAETRGMVGEGTLALAAGRLPGSPLFTALENVLGRAALEGSAYRPVTVPFRLQDDRLHLSPFEMRTSLLALGISGWADLAGPLDLRIAVRAPRDAVAAARVPARLLDLVDKGGWVTLPLRVVGTPESPRVTADGEALREQGGQIVRAVVGQQVEKGVGKLLGKLFGKR